MNIQQNQAAIDVAQTEGYARPAPAEDEFDEAALSEAYEAYFDCTTGGSFGGIRAAIKVYNEMVASRLHHELRDQEAMEMADD